jgi:flavin reductase (DIM6/NTAB) family NADH-FMN oxidoreductase RutF
VVGGVTAEVASAFDELLASLDFPMFIVTTVAVDDGERSGCLVGFATQCSIRPPRFLAGVSAVNHTAGVAARAELLAVHVVPRTAMPVASLFGQQTGDEVDKFASCAWTSGPGRVPLLDDCPMRFVGRIIDVLDLGDHRGHVLEPLMAEGRLAASDDYLRFQDLKDMQAGHPA